MLGRERGEPARTSFGEPDPHRPVVIGIRRPTDEPDVLGPVHELHGAVVAQEQRPSKVRDGRSSGVVVAADREEELVLRGGQPGERRLLLAPPQEPPQARPQLEEPSIVLRT